MFDNLWIAAVIQTLLPMITLFFLPYMIPNATQTEKLLGDDATGCDGSWYRRWYGIDTGSKTGTPRSDEDTQNAIPDMNHRGVVVGGIGGVMGGAGMAHDNVAAGEHTSLLTPRGRTARTGDADGADRDDANANNTNANAIGAASAVESAKEKSKGSSST